MEERQNNYTVAEGYELPSKGLIYGTRVNPHVELRSMSARDEMKRLNPSTTPFKTLADIIENCMIEKPAVHVYDMAVGDYEYLLHKLRIVTYGEKYKMVIGCPYCGEQFDYEANLENLEVKEFDQAKYEELRTFTLPRSGKLVSLKFQTPRMLDEIELRVKEKKRKFKDAEIDFETMETLLACIEAVDGTHLNEMQMEGFIDKLPALDMTKILQNITAMNKALGLENEMFVDCPKCHNEVKTFFRFGPEFFRPTNI